MESAEQMPSRPGFTANTTHEEEERRNKAIRLFTENPPLAKRQYPDLIESLCSFFLSSSNPHDGVTGQGSSNLLLHNNWENARSWARQFIADNEWNAAKPKYDAAAGAGKMMDGDTAVRAEH